MVGIGGVPIDAAARGRDRPLLPGRVPSWHVQQTLRGARARRSPDPAGAGCFRESAYFLNSTPRPAYPFASTFAVSP